MKKWLLYLILAAALLSIGMIYRLYNKPHRQAADEAPLAVDATVLFNDFANREAEANAKYLDRVLQVRGTVATLETNQQGGQVVVLQTNDVLFGIRCTLTQPQPWIAEGMALTVQGFCKGYLSDVVLTDCIVVNQP